MKRIDTSHAEFMECADKLRAASMGVQASAWADMREGVHKLEKAASLNVCENSIRTLRDENDKLRAELEAANLPKELVDGAKALRDEISELCAMLKEEKVITAGWVSLSPTCPYCGAAMNLWVDTDSDGHELSAFYTCPECKSDSPFIEERYNIKSAALEAALRRWAAPKDTD